MIYKNNSEEQPQPKMGKSVTRKQTGGKRMGRERADGQRVSGLYAKIYCLDRFLCCVFYHNNKIRYLYKKSR